MRYTSRTRCHVKGECRSVLAAVTLNYEGIGLEGKGNVDRREKMRSEGCCEFVSNWVGYEIEYCRVDEEW